MESDQMTDEERAKEIQALRSELDRMTAEFDDLDRKVKMCGEDLASISEALPNRGMA